MPCPVKPGVLTGDDVLALFKWAKDSGFAIPAINCVSSSSVNACLEAAAKTKNPVIIQISQGGGAFYCGKGVKDDGYKATTAGSVALAHHVRCVAPLYGVPVVIHSDHCAKKLLPWFDGMLDADEAYFKVRAGGRGRTPRMPRTRRALRTLALQASHGSASPPPPSTCSHEHLSLRC
jgi:fructose-bisphosphate aldolase class II